MVEMDDLGESHKRFGADFLETLESFDKGKMSEVEIKEEIKGSVFYNQLKEYLVEMMMVFNWSR